MSANESTTDTGLPCLNPTEAYWQCPPHAIASHQSPTLPSEVSVVIIGSGITGASVAYHLLQRRPDLEVVMLEARSIASGATGRNGGHCKEVSFKTYGQLRTQFGREAAKRLVRFRRSHVDATRQIARQLREDGFGDARFRDVQSLTAVFSEAIFQEYKNNLEALLEDFPEDRDSYSVIDGGEAQKKHGLLGACGIIASPAAALWPYRLVTGVLDRLLRNNQHFRLEAFTPVSSISASDMQSHPYVIHTSRGTIRTRDVIHCTNGHAVKLLPALQDKILPVRGQMTALTPSDGFPRLGHATSWSLCWAGGGFDYMTQADDAEGVVFLGGGIEQAKNAGAVDLGVANDSSLNSPALNHLTSVLPKCFRSGEGTALKQAWTGIMGFTPDGFPLVGKVPDELGSTKVVNGAAGHEWIAAGFSGYGMVHCWRSGKAIADMVSGQSQDIDFPTEQFSCSVERLENMDIEDLRSQFMNDTQEPIKSRL